MQVALHVAFSHRFRARNGPDCFISVASRDLMLPVSLTKRLVSHARQQDFTDGYAADWTMEPLLLTITTRFPGFILDHANPYGRFDLDMDARTTLA